MHVTPCLGDAKPIQEATILEIGCGTGSSVVALAEQGAKVIAVDIDENSLSVARERCRVYGVDASFFKANATEVHRLFSGEHFDLIIFYASLEHMTHESFQLKLAQTFIVAFARDFYV